MNHKTEFEYPYTILTVERQNYEVMGKGDWYTIKYQIYFDGSYIIEYYILDKDINNPKFIKSESGQLSPIKFFRLKKLLDRNDWDTSNRETESDEDIWKLGYFSPSGKLLESMGDININNDDKILTQIIKCLPKIKKIYKK